MSRIRYLRRIEEPFLIHGQKIVGVLPAFHAENSALPGPEMVE